MDRVARRGHPLRHESRSSGLVGYGRLGQGSRRPPLVGRGCEGPDDAARGCQDYLSGRSDQTMMTMGNDLPNVDLNHFRGASAGPCNSQPRPSAHRPRILGCCTVTEELGLLVASP